MVNNYNNNLQYLYMIAYFIISLMIYPVKIFSESGKLDKTKEHVRSTLSLGIISLNKHITYFWESGVYMDEIA